MRAAFYQLAFLIRTLSNPLAAHLLSPLRLYRVIMRTCAAYLSIIFTSRIEKSWCRFSIA